MNYIVEKVEVSRFSRDGVWHQINFTVYTDTFDPHPSWVADNNFPQNNEDEVISQLCDIIEVQFGLGRLRPEVVQAFNHMREFDLGGNFQQWYKIPVLPEKPKAHQSCKLNDEQTGILEDCHVNELFQSQVKEKLANVNKDSKVVKFFEDKKCSVCLSSYKKILNDNLHIVVPTCGHPLCCKCADNILVSEKKDCPQCRRNITADSFNLMRFYADLEIVTHDQRIFL